MSRSFSRFSDDTLRWEIEREQEKKCRGDERERGRKKKCREVTKGLVMPPPHTQMRERGQKKISRFKGSVNNTRQRARKAGQEISNSYHSRGQQPAQNQQIRKTAKIGWLHAIYMGFMLQNFGRKFIIFQIVKKLKHQSKPRVYISGIICS